MPQGETYIKYQTGMSVTATNRYSYSNGAWSQNNSGDWVDAYMEWGVSLDSTALSALMAPAPLKDMIENSVATEHGKRVVRTDRKYNERTLTLGINLTASTKATFLTRYGNFCTYVLGPGIIDLTTKYQAGVVYHLDYLSCQSFGEYQREMAKFSLRVVEPNPGNRT